MSTQTYPPHPAPLAVPLIEAVEVSASPSRVAEPRPSANGGSSCSMVWAPRSPSPPPDHRFQYNGWCDLSIPEELLEGETHGYGWRPRIAPDGSEEFVEVELTVEDLLNPRMDDHPWLTHSHSLNTNRLFSALRWQLRDDLSKTVFFDYGFRLPTVVDCCPDISVVSDLPFGLDLQHRLDLDELGARCLLAIEVASVSTRDVLRNDTVRKFERYGAARIPEYVIILPRGLTPNGMRRYSLLGYRLVDGQYRRMVPNYRGRLWLQTIRLWIGIKPGEHTEVASFYEMGTGEELQDQLAAMALAEAERQRTNAAERLAAQERQRAETEARRAETERQRADTESERAEAERQRADTESRRAEAAEQVAALERERTAALEAKIRELMAALRQ